MNEKCERCGKPATHIQETDPYSEEINGDYSLHDMCDDCFRERCDEI
jgi:ribosomal protein S14